MNRDAVGWGQDIWNRIDQAALDEAKRSSLAAAFLPLVGPMPSALTVPADAIQRNPLCIAEDQFRPIVELSVDFTPNAGVPDHPSWADSEPTDAVITKGQGKWRIAKKSENIWDVAERVR
jgi:hypothetical protein